MCSSVFNYLDVSSSFCRSETRTFFPLLLSRFPVKSRIVLYLCLSLLCFSPSVSITFLTSCDHLLLQSLPRPGPCCKGCVRSLYLSLRQIFVATVSRLVSNRACRCGADMTQSKEAAVVVVDGGYEQWVRVSECTWRGSERA